MENFDSIFGKQDQSKILNNFDKQAWAEKKQAERSAVYVLIDETAADMTESGKSFRMGLDVMARFDRYSVGNILLITAQCPDATKLADFDTWAAMSSPAISMSASFWARKPSTPTPTASPVVGRAITPPTGRSVAGN